MRSEVEQLWSRNAELIDTGSESFTINPAFFVKTVKYVFVQVEVYERPEWQRLMTAMVWDTTQVIIFPIDVATTSRSTLSQYDAGFVDNEVLANELCNMSCRLQFVDVIPLPSAIIEARYLTEACMTLGLQIAGVAQTVTKKRG